MKLMVFLTLLAVLAVAAGTGYSFQQINASRHQGRIEYLHTWHQVICSIESATNASKQVPPAKKRQVNKFYNGLLVQIGADPCP